MRALFDTGAQMSIIGADQLPSGATRHYCGPHEQARGACDAPIETAGYALLNAGPVHGCPSVNHWVQVSKKPVADDDFDIVLGLNYMEAADLVLRPKRRSDPMWCPKRPRKPRGLRRG